MISVRTEQKKARGFRSIKMFMLISFLSINLILLVFVSVIQNYFNFKTQQSLIVTQEELIVMHAAGEVRSFIDNKFNELEAAVRYGDQTTFGIEQQKHILAKIIGSDFSFRTSVFLDLQKQETSSISRLSKLESNQLDNKIKSDIFIKVSRGENYISQVFVEHATGEPFIIIAIPVKDVFGDFKQILVAEVNLKFMWDLVGEIQVGQKGLVYVVDGEGKLIAFKDSSRVLKRENLSYLEEVQEFKKENSLNDPNPAIMTKGINKTIVLTTYAGLESTNWAVVVELPIFEAYQSFISAVGLSLLTTLIAILLSIILTIYLARKITKPIIQLTNAAAMIEAGDLGVQIDIKTNDEVGLLALAFNQMTTKLKDSYFVLEQKVKEKTAQLEIKIEEQEKTSKAMLNILEDERVLEADLEKFKLAIENISDHVIITDPEGIIIYVNKAAEKMTGYLISEMLGKRPSLWGNQMPKEFYKQMWDLIKNKKQTFEGEIKNKKKTGELYPVNSKITPILDKNGNISFFVGIERDISAEKKLANTLLSQNQEITKQVNEQTEIIKQEQQRLFKFLESIPEGIYVLNSMGKPFYANLAAKRLLGQGILDTEPSELSEIYQAYIAGTDKLYPPEQNPIAVALTGKASTIRDIEVRSNDKITPLEVTGAPIMDEHGNITYSLAVFHDISEEKIQERSKDEFFSIASHELRTPLTAIRGNTSLIKQYYQEKIQDKDLNEMIDDIHESSIRLIGIVNDFLNVSRLEQGKMEFKFENFDIVELLKKKITESKSLVDGKNLTILLDLPTIQIPQVYADKDRLSEVILNLLGNAVKYSEKGTIEVKISTENNFVKVIVSDKGRGVSKEQQNLLFRKFQQAGESLLTRDTSKGTGLGLYISRLMIEQMGGKIQLESSEENKGSAFSFVVPVAK